MRLLFPILLLLPRILVAQGVTTAAIQGTVIGEDKAPVVGATVRVTNTLNGRRWEVATQSAGGYLLEDVDVGGPYVIEVRALGFAPQTRSGIVLNLGQRLVTDFTLRPAAVELAAVAVGAQADPVLNPSRTGPAEVISSARIAALPNLGQDFLTLTTLSPQVVISPSTNTANSGGISISGQNRLLNGFEIDGGLNFDPYTGRLPGRTTLPRPISLGALREIQVLVAPFDVRYGGFAGGLANAVTQSGTNDMHGSVFGYLADATLVGRNSVGDPAGPFTTWQYGGTIGGPIVRDRVQYFMSVDVQRRAVPDPGPLITDTAGGADTTSIGIRYASAARFQSTLRNTYGLDPGTLGPSDARVPATDVFGKITLQVSTNSHLELSHHYADGDRWGFLGRFYGQYNLTSVSRRDPSTADASRLIWTSLLGGRWSNELIASYLRLRDTCLPNANYPLIRVNADRGLLLAGPPATCPTSFRQEAFELTDNVTAAFGAHVLTLGAHGEVLSLEDGQMSFGGGLWNFRNLDSLAAGRAFHYERALVGPSGVRDIEFHPRQLGVYAQDRWNPVHHLTLAVGLRVDVPVLPDAVATNQALKAALGVVTSVLPSGNPLWSPRLGFNYDVRGEGRTFFRGGVGLFSGPPPFTWIGSAYRDDGTHRLYLTCDGAAVPAFDPVNQPTACANGAQPIPQLSVFDHGLRFPQNLKVTLGVDHRLPGDIVGTLDVLYTRAVHQWYFSDANLGSPVGVSQGEGNRPLYGTISAGGGFATPARLAPAFGPVIRASDRNGDRSFALSVQLRKQFGDRVEASGFYAYTRARDVMSLANVDQAGANLNNIPLDGTLANRRLATSYFEVPHRIEVSTLVRLPYRTQFSLLYLGGSGLPFTYVIVGDANADGIGSSLLMNDIVYVPRDSADITLANPADWRTLDGFVARDPCLSRQRGRILARNSCRNAWFGTVNTRLIKDFPTISGHSFEVTADLYNMLDLISRQWGQSRATAPNPPSQPLLRLVGYDTAAGRGIYRLQLPAIDQVQDLASRWQVELGLRYIF